MIEGFLGRKLEPETTVLFDPFKSIGYLYSAPDLVEYYSSLQDTISILTLQVVIFEGEESDWERLLAGELKTMLPLADSLEESFLTVKSGQKATVRIPAWRGEEKTSHFQLEVISVTDYTETIVDVRATCRGFPSGMTSEKESDVHEYDRIIFDSHVIEAVGRPVRIYQRSVSGKIYGVVVIADVMPGSELKTSRPKGVLFHIPSKKDGL